MDGYLDGVSEHRLLLSNDADFDRIDEVRAGCDAILVGATTVRRDNPRLLVRSAARRDDRVARGLPPSPMKVTVTNCADLDAEPTLRPRRRREDRLLLDRGDGQGGGPVRPGRRPWSTAASRWSFDLLAEDLYRRGVHRLMVEGGGETHTQFLTAGLADELQLVVAPMFVGDSQARRFVSDGRFPWNPDRRATLAEVRQIGDVALLRYALSPRFDPS